MLRRIISIVVILNLAAPLVLKEQRIFYAYSVPEIRSVMPAARYYYFKVEGDPEVDIGGVTPFDITQIVKMIIEALSKASGIVKDELLDELHRASRKFALGCVI